MKDKTETERVIEALEQIGLKTSLATVEGIILTYHSCGIEGCSLTLEETAQSIGWDIREKLLKKIDL